MKRIPESRPRKSAGTRWLGRARPRPAHHALGGSRRALLANATPRQHPEQQQQRKNTWGPTRLCTVVRKRAKLLVHEKIAPGSSDCAASPARTRARRSAKRVAGRGRRAGASRSVSRSMSVYRMSAVPASTPTTMPLDSTARAAARSRRAASRSVPAPSAAGQALCVGEGQHRGGGEERGLVEQVEVRDDHKKGLTASATSGGQGAAFPIERRVHR